MTKWAQERGLFIREVEGELYGVGVHPGLKSDLMWEFAWLTMPDVLINPYLDENVNQDNLPTTHWLLPIIIGSAYQIIEDRLSTLHILKECSTPKQFLDRVKAAKYYKGMLLTHLHPEWIDQTRADQVSVEKAKVLSGNFGGR